MCKPERRVEAMVAPDTYVSPEFDCDDLESEALALLALQQMMGFPSLCKDGDDCPTGHQCIPAKHVGSEGDDLTIRKNEKGGGRCKWVYIVDAPGKVRLKARNCVCVEVVPI